MESECQSWRVGVEFEIELECWRRDSVGDRIVRETSY